MKNTQTNTRRKGIDKDLIFYCIVLIYPLLQCAFFFIGVNFNSIILAFQRYDALNAVYLPYGFGNFQRVWTELVSSSILIDALLNSILVWFCGTAIGTTLSVLFSYYIFKKYPGANAFKFILFLPSILPSILLVIMFKVFVNEAIPQVIETLTGTLINPPLMDVNSRFGLVVFYGVWLGFGAQILLYVGSMSQIEPSVLEAAKLDGARPMRELWSVVIPDILPSVNTFIISGIAGLFVNQANVHAFFDGRDVATTDLTIGYYLFDLAGIKGAAEYPYASALGICCSLIAFPITFLLRWVLNKLEDF